MPRISSPRAPALSIIVMSVIMLAGPFLNLQGEHYRHHWRLAPQGVFSDKAMVVSAHGIASQVGRDVLASGGNSFDAAVAVNFALAVVYQQAGNIGGGGFMVYRLADGQTGALDFREKAPLAASANMYLDDNGEVIKGLSLKGHLSVGVPGAVAGMVALHERFGTQPWDTLIRPSIYLADSGFERPTKAARMFNRYQDDFATVNRHRPRVVKDQPWQAGEQISFPDLAQTLSRIAKFGRDGFYDGRTAQLIVEEMQAGGGLVTRQDLRAYQAVWRQPVQFSYRGHEIISMPPPSSGGVALAPLLQGAQSSSPSILKASPMRPMWPSVCATLKSTARPTAPACARAVSMSLKASRPRISRLSTRWAMRWPSPPR